MKLTRRGNFVVVFLAMLVFIAINYIESVGTMP